MLGYIEYTQNGESAYLEKRTRCGAQFLVLDMGKGARGMLSSYRAARAAEKMRAEASIRQHRTRHYSLSFKGKGPRQRPTGAGAATRSPKTPRQPPAWIETALLR